MAKSNIDRRMDIARTNVKRAFGALPLEAINKLTDRQILSQKHIGLQTFIYIRSLGQKVDWK